MFSSQDRPFLQRSCNKIFATITTGAATPNGSYKEHVTYRNLLRVRLVGNVAQTLNPKRSLSTSQRTPSTRSVKSGLKSKAADIDRSATGMLARTLRLLLSHFVKWNPPCLSKEQSCDTKLTAAFSAAMERNRSFTLKFRRTVSVVSASKASLKSSATWRRPVYTTRG